MAQYCKKRDTILETLGETESELKCDTRELETIISCLEEIEQVPVCATLRHMSHLKFSLTGMCRVRKIGSEGSDNGQFNLPLQLTTDPIGRVFIADRGNYSICIHDPDLNHLRNITHQSMSGPYDVKVSRDRLYVLCPSNNPCLHVLTLEGDKLHSRITCGEGMDVLRPWFFCLDPLNNFVLSDLKSHSIRVFSPEGNLLHTIGREGHQQGMLYHPTGVAITPNGRLVCVSSNENYGLQIFY